MGKEIRDKRNSQRQSEPYNVSNSSFANRLSGYFSGWLPSRLTNSEDHEVDHVLANSRIVEVEINHVESSHSNSNNKRLSSNHNNISPSNNVVKLTHNNSKVEGDLGNEITYSPTNNIAGPSGLPNKQNPLLQPSSFFSSTPELVIGSSKSNKQQGDEICSPILSSNRDPQITGTTSGSFSPLSSSNRHPRDLQIIGTNSSGFQSQSQSNKQVPHHNFFVSSTPAFNVKQPTTGDNEEGSGESTSGCSSLVSQSNKMKNVIDLERSRTLFPNRQIHSDNISKINRSGPHFDSTQFMSSSPSIRKSINYPFYPGSPVYGGASSYRNVSYKSRMTPDVFKPSFSRCVKPKAKNSISTPHLSAAAQNILKSINAMTTVSRIIAQPRREETNEPSLRGSNVHKRKLAELQIPTVVDLVQLKRCERLNTLSRVQNESSSSSSDSELDYSIITQNTKKSLQEKIKRPRTGQSKDEQSQTSEKCTADEDRVQSKADTKYKMDLDISFSNPIEVKSLNISTESSVLLISNDKDESNKSSSSNSSFNFVYNNDSTQPRPKLNTSVPRQITLPPIEATFPYSRNSFAKSSEQSLLLKSKIEPWKCHICNMNHTAGEVLCETCKMPRTNKELQSITLPTSTSTDLKTIPSSISTNSSSSNSLLNSFKPAEGTWECSGCLVRNKADVNKCICCESPKPSANKSTPTSSLPNSTPLVASTGFGDMFKKPSGNWECSVCMISNKSDVNKCVACETIKPESKPSSTTASTGFGDMFKKPTGNWECSACMISNKSDANKCVACETAKPGSKVTPDKSASNKGLSGPKFPFATTSSDAPTFKFGIDKVDSSASSTSNKTETLSTSVVSTPSTFSFGVPSSIATTSTAQSTSTAPAFSFGIPKSTISAATNSDSKPVSVLSSPAISSNPLLSKSPITSSNLASSTSLTSNILKSTSSVVSSNTTAPSFSFGAAATPSSVTPKATFSFGSTNGPIGGLSKLNEVNTATESPQVEPSKSLFGNSMLSSDKASVPSLFGTSGVLNNIEPKGLINTFTPGTSGPSEPKRVNFGTEPNNVKFDMTKPVSTPISSESKPLSIFGSSNEVSKPKENLFSFGTTNNAMSNNTNQTEQPILNSNQNTPAFGTTKPVENNLFTFGGNTTKPVATTFPTQRTTSNNTPFTFGGSSTTPAVSQPQPFNFTPSAPSSGFNFTPSSNPPTFNNISAPQPSGGNIFGESMFGASTQPSSTPAPAFGSTGGFNAPAQTNSSGAFQFGAPAVQNTNNMFSFGSQNQAPPPQQPNVGFSFGSAPTAAPTFNPNIRPTFNFSGGAAPTFNAAPQPGLQSASVAARRIKKAVRRR